jgi:hypothetical protein
VTATYVGTSELAASSWESLLQYIYPPVNCTTDLAYTYVVCCKAGS